MGDVSIAFVMRMFRRIIVSNGLVKIAADMTIRIFVVVIEAKEVLDAAIGGGQQPKHHTARRHKAESRMKLWCSRNHSNSAIKTIASPA